MIPYLVKSGLCLLVMLTAYRLLLEKEKMLRFNRLYLLFSLIFSFTVPFVRMPDRLQPIHMTNEWAAAAPGIATQITAANNNHGQVLPATQPIQLTTICWICYSLVTAVLLFRFFRNLYLIHRCISRNRQIRLDAARLVLVPENIVIHTFYKTIFTNEALYTAEGLEEEVLTHELAHVRQLHTLDILFVEVLRLLFWFNPLVLLYRRAIQLNHEFLADEAVTQAYKDPKKYQYLLLNKMMPAAHAAFSSPLNYKITKKRLIMITTTANTTSILLKKLTIAPLLIGALFLFSTGMKAQDQHSKEPKKLEFTDPGWEILGDHPYVLIDGKEYPFDILTKISPSCIASQRTYLKDGAILRYGPAGADGAVIMTTHKGGIKYITATEKENMAKERMAKTGFYHRITLKNEDGSPFDKMIINYRNGTVSSWNEKDCKVGFLVGNKLFTEDRIDEVEKLLITADLHGERGVGDSKVKHIPGLDLSSYKVIFYFE